MCFETKSLLSKKSIHVVVIDEMTDHLAPRNEYICGSGYHSWLEETYYDQKMWHFWTRLQVIETSITRWVMLFGCIICNCPQCPFCAVANFCVVFWSGNCHPGWFVLKKKKELLQKLKRFTHLRNLPCSWFMRSGGHWISLDAWYLDSCLFPAIFTAFYINSDSCINIYIYTF